MMIFEPMGTHFAVTAMDAVDECVPQLKHN